MAYVSTSSSSASSSSSRVTTRSTSSTRELSFEDQVDNEEQASAESLPNQRFHSPWAQYRWSDPQDLQQELQKVYLEIDELYDEWRPLLTFHERWRPIEDGSNSHDTCTTGDLINEAERIFGTNPENWESLWEDLQARFRRWIEILRDDGQYICDGSTRQEDDQFCTRRQKKLETMMRTGFGSLQTLITAYRTIHARDAETLQQASLDMWPQRLGVGWNALDQQTNILPAKPSIDYVVLQIVLRHFKETGCCHYNGHLYRPVVVDGRAIPYFESVLPMKKAVFAFLSSRDFATRQVVLQKTNISEKIANLILQHPVPECPELFVNRYVRGFSNGYFNCFDLTFVPIESEAYRLYDYRREGAFINYYPYLSFPAHQYLAALDNKGGGVGKIPTPYFDRVLRDQKFEEPETQEAIAAALGMCLFPRNLDGQQLGVMFQGKTATGKSTLLKILEWFYPPEFVAHIENQTERGFPVQQVNAQTMLCWIHELDAKTKLPESLLKGMLEGAKITVAYKNKDPTTLQATAPVCVDTNAEAIFRDEHGAMSRRFWKIVFNYVVRYVDTFLYDKLRYEIPALLLKCSYAWLRLRHKAKSSSLMECLPAVLREQNQKAKAQQHALSLFLLDPEQCARHPQLYCTFEAFHDALTDYCTMFNKPGPKMADGAYYEQIFHEFGLSIELAATREWLGVKKSSKWILGVTVGHEAIEEARQIHDCLVGLPQTHVTPDEKRQFEALQAERKRHLEEVEDHRHSIDEYERATKFHRRLRRSRADLWNPDNDFSLRIVEKANDLPHRIDVEFPTYYSKEVQSSRMAMEHPSKRTLSWLKITSSSARSPPRQQRKKPRLSRNGESSGSEQLLLSQSMGNNTANDFGLDLEDDDEEEDESAAAWFLDNEGQ